MQKVLVYCWKSYKKKYGKCPALKLIFYSYPSGQPACPQCNQRDRRADRGSGRKISPRTLRPATQRLFVFLDFLKSVKSGWHICAVLQRRVFFGLILATSSEKVVGNGIFWHSLLWALVTNGVKSELGTGIFFIFSIIKNDFFCTFYQVNNLFLHQSYLKSPLPVKLTW